MSFYVPSKDLDGWKKLLASPLKQWKKGYSARTLALCWLDQKLYPKEIKKVFLDYSEEPFGGMEFLFVFPEYKVPLPPYNRAQSQNDIFVIGKGGDKLIAISIEGKVSEPFDEPIKIPKNPRSGMKERSKFICDRLGLDERGITDIGYQLLHRTLSPILMAEKLNIQHALMLVHSFSESDEGFDDFTNFTRLFGVDAKPNKILESDRLVSGKKLYFAWVKGDKKYLQY